MFKTSGNLPIVLEKCLWNIPQINKGKPKDIIGWILTDYVQHHVGIMGEGCFFLIFFWFFWFVGCVIVFGFLYYLE